jgi:type IV secretion system protein VirD4
VTVAQTMITSGTACGWAAFAIARWRGRGDRTSARFARPRDLRGLTVRRPTPGRLIVGRFGRRLLAIERRHSLLVVGPPQTGKTAGLAIPAILEWPGPVLVTSSKPDVLEVTRHARAARGDIMVYDPCTDPIGSAGWTPVAAVNDWTDALVSARALMTVQAAGGVGDQDFWHASAEASLAPMLRAAAHDGGMARLVEWLDRGDDADDEIARILDAAGDSRARSAWRAVAALDPRTRSGVVATTRTALAGWWDPRVLDAAHAEITSARLLAGAATLYLVAPAHEQDRLRNIYAAIVQEMTRAVFARRARTGTPLDPALLVVLDEAAHIAPVRDLAALAATGPEPGIQLVTIFHDHAQIRAIYGPRAPSVIANHRARLLLPGVGDAETLDRISGALGTSPRRRVSRTTGRHGTTTTESDTDAPLLPAHALREMPEGSGLLTYGTRPPVRIGLRPWFADRSLRTVASGGGVEGSPPTADEPCREFPTGQG